MRSNNFDVKLTVKKCNAKANNYENNASVSVWMDFKNSFAWLTGIKKLIFDYRNFFVSGSFFDPCYLKNRQKRRLKPKSQVPKISAFMHVDQAKEFVDSHNSFSAKLVLQCTFHRTFASKLFNPITSF